jgi:hypothetical protein
MTLPSIPCNRPIFYRCLHARLIVLWPKCPNMFRWSKPAVGEFSKTRHPRNAEFNKVLEACFSEAGNSRLSESWNLWSLEIREYAKFGNLDSVKKWSHEHAEAWNLELSMARTSESGQFGNLSRAEFGSQARGHARTSGEAKANSGNCWRPCSGVSYEDIHEPGEKQSQSCCPKKSEFRVWTSGRFVNMLDEKDNHVCVHTRNILWG